MRSPCLLAVFFAVSVWVPVLAAAPDGDPQSATEAVAADEKLAAAQETGKDIEAIDFEFAYEMARRSAQSGASADEAAEVASRVIRGEAVFLPVNSPTDSPNSWMCASNWLADLDAKLLQHQVIRSEGWPEVGDLDSPRLLRLSRRSLSGARSSWRSSHPRSETARPSAHTHAMSTLVSRDSARRPSSSATTRLPSSPWAPVPHSSPHRVTTATFPTLTRSRHKHHASGAAELAADTARRRGGGGGNRQGGRTVGALYPQRRAPSVARLPELRQVEQVSAEALPFCAGRSKSCRRARIGRHRES